MDAVYPEGIWLGGRGRLSSELGWDSHTSIMAIDEAGYVHLCGNMHVDPLIYFRTTRPLDVTSFERIDHMVGTQEDRCTYPVFMQGPDNSLVFRYQRRAERQRSGFLQRIRRGFKAVEPFAGHPTTRWAGSNERLRAHAREGPDGLWHMVWMWRDTPDCATNHSISYAQSEDLCAGERAARRAVAAHHDRERRRSRPSVPRGGLINMTQSLGRTLHIVRLSSYHKHDEKGGDTQAYCARLEQGAWVIYQLSRWTYRMGIWRGWFHSR